MYRKPSFPAIASGLLASFAGLILLMLTNLDVLNDRFGFTALCVLLTVYIVMEIARLRRLHHDRWLINPVVMCSMITFCLGYGITNILFFLPKESLSFIGYVPKVTAAMVKLMFLVLLGVIAMWLGYWSTLAARLSRDSNVVAFNRRFLPSTDVLRPLTLPILLVISLGVRLFAIKLGIFGYSSNYEQLIQAAQYTQYISMASGFGKLALVFVSLQYYRSGRQGRYKKWLYGLLVIEVAFGFLSGFKTAVVMPFAIVALCRYLRTGKLPRIWFVFVLLGLTLAYQIVEPFRVLKNAQGNKGDYSLVGLGTMVVEAGKSPSQTRSQSSPLLLRLAGRHNLTWVGSVGIEYADKHSVLPKSAPRFLENIILAPLHAWIPRFIWQSKPLANEGLWYTRTVMGQNYKSSTAMGPFTYLYFSGGALAVFLGFFLIGILQRALFFLLAPSTNLSGAVIFMVMLAPVVMINSAVNGLVVSLFREIPILLFVMFLVIRRRSVAGDASLMAATKTSVVMRK
jgi:hypothetical protein